MAWLNHNQGLSLLGTLIAVFVLSTVALAGSQLVVRTGQSVRLSRESFTATLLGREGLELVRALRDTNWFLRRSDSRRWTQGLCAGDFTLDPDMVRRLTGMGDLAAAQLYIAHNGEWLHTVTDHPTPYQRLLTVNCSQSDTTVLVTAKITWQGADGRSHAWNISEQLYDWLPPE